MRTVESCGRFTVLKRARYKFENDQRNFLRHQAYNLTRYTYADIANMYMLNSRKDKYSEHSTEQLKRIEYELTNYAKCKKENML